MYLSNSSATSRILNKVNYYKQNTTGLNSVFLLDEARGKQTDTCLSHGQ